MDLTCRKNILSDVSVWGADHNRAPFSDQALCNRSDCSCFLRIQSQESGNAVRIAQHPYSGSRQSYLNSGQLIFRNPADMPDFINNGNLLVQTVFHKYCLISLKDQPPDIKFRNMLVQPCRNLLIGELICCHYNIGNSRFPLPDIFQMKKITGCLTCSCRSGRIVPDHGRFGNNGFCNGLHCRISDHRGCLIKTHKIKGA